MVTSSLFLCPETMLVRTVERLQYFAATRRFYGCLHDFGCTRAGVETFAEQYW